MSDDTNIAPPSLSDFDCYHAGMSGGKDSTALVFWLRFKSGLPLERMDVTFCDTGNEDALTYAYIDLLREIIAPVEIKVIRPPLDFWELAYSRHSFPTRRARFCTQELKIIPTRAYVLDLQRSGRNVLMMNGVRRAEGRAGNERGSAARWEHDWDGFGAWLYRPIVDWSIEQVWSIHREFIAMDDVLGLVRDDPTMGEAAKRRLIDHMVAFGAPCNPLYAMGATRVGCFPCINSRKSEMRAMGHYRPERIDFIEQQEMRVGSVNPLGYCNFFHSTSVPKRWRSRRISGTTIRKQEYIELNVPTIRDVVEWSKTARGGVQYDMDFDLPPASACDIGGMCE